MLGQSSPSNPLDAGRRKRKVFAVFAIFCIVAAVALVFYFWKPGMLEKITFKSSKAVATVYKFLVGLDDYVGYFFWMSDDFQLENNRQGIEYEPVLDEGDYESRFKLLAEGKYPLIKMPHFAFLMLSEKYKNPGLIVMTIAGSQGVDFAAARKSIVRGNGLRDFANPSYKFIYVEGSASHYLINAAIWRYKELSPLRQIDSWRQPAKNWKELREMVLNGQGHVILGWEPSLTTLIEEVNERAEIGNQLIDGFSSKDMPIIEDVLIARSDKLEEDDFCNASAKMLSAYFNTMQLYEADKPRLIKDLAKSCRVNEQRAESILGRIDYYSLEENLQDWFGIATVPGAPTRERMAQSLRDAAKTLVESKMVPNMPLPGGNPYKLISTKLLERLAENYKSSFLPGAATIAKDFSQLSDSDWKKLPDFGTLDLDYIPFPPYGEQQSLSIFAKERLDDVARQMIDDYEEHRFVIVGHCPKALSWSPSAEQHNKTLTQNWAGLALQYLVAAGVPETRLHAEGRGTDYVVPPKTGESPRQFKDRQNGVSFVAKRENKL